MKKVISLILVMVFTLGLFVTSPLSAVTAADAEKAVQVEIAPYLYKSTLYQMEFPNPSDYTVKDKSVEGDYVISRDLNDLSYTFTFPAGTTEIACELSLNGSSDWRGFRLNAQDNPGYWEKNPDGSVDYSKPLCFVRNDVTAERDEYGVLYRDHLMNKGVEGFRDIDTIYWRLSYVLKGEALTQSFQIKLYDYDAAEKHTVKAVNFNVAGLPFGFFSGQNVYGNQKAAGEYLSGNDFDIVAVQEDFTFHNQLVNNMKGFNYATEHTGGIPGGDGLNIFTKDMPIYNEQRVAWNDACGILSDGSDELTPKGFVYSVIDVGNGIYVDFYNLHADAYGGSGSIEARTSQLRQLADFIKARSAENDRPVIVTGDFNCYMHVHEDDGALYKTLYQECGLKDAWIEYHNDGDYFNLYQWHISGLPAWGNWDSVERFMYKSGGGVDIVVDDFRYTEVCNASGKVISDHSSAECDFTFVKTEDFVKADQSLSSDKPSTNKLFNFVRWIILDLILVLSDLGNLSELF